ncbi:unnamed protein product [marine sediment metagenome]|uniref:Uncharacterized protein n=1 Tax=marine sediment metagenome TaxID=412755 RepID=X0U840_9ZZZZ
MAIAIKSEYIMNKMKKKKVTYYIAEDVAEQLDKVARETGRIKSVIAEKGIKKEIEYGSGK